MGCLRPAQQDKRIFRLPQPFGQQAVMALDLRPAGRVIDPVVAFTGILGEIEELPGFAAELVAY